MNYKNPMIAVIGLMLAACGPPLIVTEKGPQGAKGDKGDPAAPCTVSKAENGALIECPDGSSELVFEEQGQSISELIDPCGDNVGEFDEVLIRLTDTTLIAFFEQGGKRFLAEIGPGNYVTTDKQKCNFTVTEDLQVNWESGE